MVDVWVFAVEFIRHQPRIFVNMELRAAAHARQARLLPGKHANSFAHFRLRSMPPRQAYEGTIAGSGACALIWVKPTLNALQEK